MGRKKQVVDSESDSDMPSRSATPKGKQSSENDTTYRTRNRLKKEKDMQPKVSERKSSAKKRNIEYSEEESDEEKFSMGKSSRGKSGNKQVQITEFTKSGKSSSNQKVVVVPKEKLLLERKKKQDLLDDDYNMLNEDLSEESDSDEEFIDEDEDDQLAAFIKGAEKNKKNGGTQVQTSKPKLQEEVKMAPTVLTRSTASKSNAMDIEIENVRGNRSKSKSKEASISKKTPIIKLDEEPKQEIKSSKVKKSMKKSNKKEDIEEIEEVEGEGKNIKGILSDERIVFSGIFHNCSTKDEIIQMVKILGAQSPGSVSNKTTLLVHGYKLDEGRDDVREGGKYKEAVKKGVKIMSETDFEDRMRKLTGFSLLELITDKASQIAKYGIDKVSNQNIKMDEEIQIGTRKRPVICGGNVDISDSAEVQAGHKNDLWADKYAPQHLGQIIGNQGLVSKLEIWLRDWEEVNIRGQKKEIKFKGGFNPNSFSAENLNAKAALLSGSPGIGKTTAVRLVCKKMGLNLIEQNASDMRNKNAIKGVFSCMGDNTSINFQGEIGRSVILMDEVDGMTSDRGGTAALNEYIKKTKVPIICICNDRQHPKMRTLAGNCYDLRFIKPARPQIVEAIKKIVFREVVFSSFRGCLRTRTR